MRVFVTGATGFIGRRLLDHLLRAGVGVTALVRRETQELPVSVATCRGDLGDEVGKLAAHMQGHDVLYHLAAKVSFDPADLDVMIETNGEGTRRILAAAAQAEVARTVVVSSACTIGLSTDPNEVLDENTPADPALESRNPYLKSKLVAERYAQTAVAEGQWVVIVNPTTVFGPGDRSLNSGTLVRQVAGASVMPVPSGGSNVIDIDDVVTGIIAAGQNGRSGGRYILGGANLRFREIIDRIVTVVGRRPFLVFLPAMARLPMAMAAWWIHKATGSRLITPQIVADTFAFKFYSSHRAESELGWRARRDFTDTLSSAWDYYLEKGLITCPSGAVA